MEVQRTSQIYLLIEPEQMCVFSGSIYHKHIWFLCICRTWRCENVMSYWNDQGTIPCMNIVLASKLIAFDSNTMCASMFMVLALFDLFYRFGATSAICDNIHGKWNQRAQNFYLGTETPEMPDKFRATTDSNDDNDDAKYDETNANHGWANRMSPHMRVFVNSEHLLMTIREPTSKKVWASRREKNMHTHTQTAPFQMNRENGSKLCNSTRYELFHSFSVYDISIVCIVKMKSDEKVFFPFTFPFWFVCSFVRLFIFLPFDLLPKW